MGKTLSELSRSLKEFIEDSQDAHTGRGIKKYRYNNLKIDIVDPRASKTPQITISIGISEASFNLVTGEKTNGSLGPDERYVLRWLDRGSNKEELREILKDAQKHVGKAKASD